MYQCIIGDARLTGAHRDTSKPSLLPSASHKTAVFRNRFNVVHQRLLRHESFQSSAVSETRAPSLRRSSSSMQSQQALKITPIANLLGRHGTHHMLLGMLTVLPTGTLAICDLTGAIALDLSHAASVPEDSAWFAPGMIVLVDGVYGEEEESVGKGLNGSSGIGGTIGGRFQGYFIGQPPCERRRATLGVSGPDGDQDHTIGGGFGWIDFLGVGSERAVGSRMRKLEHRLLRQPPPGSDSRGRGRMVVLGELNLDQPRTLEAVRHILGAYAAEAASGSTPMAFILAGNFTQHAVMARSDSGGSIEYKEYFDNLASVLAEFPSLLSTSTLRLPPGRQRRLGIGLHGWRRRAAAPEAGPGPLHVAHPSRLHRRQQRRRPAQRRGRPGRLDDQPRPPDALRAVPRAGTLPRRHYGAHAPDRRATKVVGEAAGRRWGQPAAAAAASRRHCRRPGTGARAGCYAG